MVENTMSHNEFVELVKRLNCDKIKQESFVYKKKIRRLIKRDLKAVKLGSNEEFVSGYNTVLDIYEYRGWLLGIRRVKLSAEYIGRDLDFRIRFSKVKKVCNYIEETS